MAKGKTRQQICSAQQDKRIAVAKAKKEDFFGRLEGIIEIVGDLTSSDHPLVLPAEGLLSNDLCHRRPANSSAASC